MSIHNIYNFVKISDMIGTSGYPDDHQFKDISDNGYEIVINLVSDDPDDVLRASEKKILKELGLTYIHIPVVWEHPQLDDFEYFCDVLEKNKGKKVFIHCELNMRVSVFIMLYRIIYNGMDKKKALIDVHKIWKPHDQWETFINETLHKLTPCFT